MYKFIMYNVQINNVQCNNVQWIMYSAVYQCNNVQCTYNVIMYYAMW